MAASIAEEEMLMGIVDSHSGMITREAAARELSARKEAERIYTVSELMLHGATQHLVNIEDRVYRIFNKASPNAAALASQYRKMVIGNEPACMVMTLWGQHADCVDSMGLTAGSVLRIFDVRLLAKGKEPELSSTSRTSFTLVNRTILEPTKLSSLRPGQRGLTIFSTVLATGKRGTEVRAGRHLSAFHVTLSDGEIEMPASFIGSSSVAAFEATPGDLVTIENCTVVGLAVAPRVVAEDNSRILIKRIQRKPKDI